MNKTKYFLLIIFTFILLFFCDCVYALDYCYDYEEGESVDGCYVVCTYEYQLSSGFDKGASGKVYNYDSQDVKIQIGYNPSTGNYHLYAIDYDETYFLELWSNKFSLVNYWSSMIKNSNVIINDQDSNFNTFSCPIEAYLDVLDINEICFNNSDNYCIDNYGEYTSYATTFFGHESGFSSYYTWDYEDILLPSAYTSSSDSSSINSVVIDFVSDMHDDFIDDLEDIAKKVADIDEFYDEMNALIETYKTDMLSDNTIIDNVNDSYFSTDQYYLIIDLLTASSYYPNYKEYIYERVLYYMTEYFGASSDGETFTGGDEALDLIQDYFPDVTEEEVVENTDHTVEDVLEVFYADFVVADSSLREILGGALECDALLGNPEEPGEPAYYLQLALNVLRYVAIVALVLLSTIDYTKAVASSDADALQQANQRVIKRVIYTVILFMFPSVLEFVFNLTGIYDNPLCGLQ